MSSILANAFKIGAMASAALGTTMTVPFLAEKFWVGVGLSYSKDVAAISFCWGLGVQFMLAVIKLHLAKLCETNKPAMIHMGKLHAFWWALVAAVSYISFPGGPLLTPLELGMLSLSALFGYASCQECEKSDSCTKCGMFCTCKCQTTEKTKNN